MKKSAEAGLRDFSDFDYQKKYFLQIKKTLATGNNIFERIKNARLPEMPDIDIKGLFLAINSTMCNIFGYYISCQPQCLSLVEKTAKEKLSENIPEEKVPEIFAILTAPNKINKIKQEELDWLNLLIDAKKNNLSKKEIKNRLSSHYAKYFLLNASDGQAALSLEHYFNKFMNDITSKGSSLSRKASEILASTKKTDEEKKLISVQNKLAAEPLDMCCLLADIGHWRLEMRFVWMIGYHYSKMILDEISSRFNCDKNTIRFATISEIMQLFDQKPLPKKILEARSKSFLFSIEDGRPILFSGDKADQKYRSCVTHDNYNNITELKGNVSMEGKISGHVIVYNWGDDIQAKLSKAKGSFILVSGQTRPQLMPLLRKCAGIITDEGGITSHAAIVSRELGKPCIIGTKIATKVLKDGDKVEIDANNGIIKIISRS